VIAHRKICECGQRRKNVEYSFGRWTSPCRPTSPSRGGQGLTSTRLALITVTSRVAQFGRDNHLLFDLHISRMWTRMPKQPESQTTGMAGSQSARMSGHQDIRTSGSQEARGYGSAQVEHSEILGTNIAISRRQSMAIGHR